MFHRWSSEKACILIASPGVSMIDPRCIILSLESVVSPSTFLLACTFVSMTLQKQQAPHDLISQLSGTRFCLFICLLTYSLCYLRANLAVKTRMVSNFPSVCSSLPSAEFPGCVSNQVFASLSIIYLVRLSLLPCLENVKTFPQHGFPTDLFWNLLCRTLSSFKIHFRPYQGLVNSR